MAIVDLDRLKAIAEEIDTGVGDLAVARALVVFNVGDQPASGFACFPSEIGWPVGVSMPSIMVEDRSGMAVRSALRSIVERPDPKGRPDRRRISFDLIFEAIDVPGQGWKVYVARYAEGGLEWPVDVDEPVVDEFVVVETGFHGGTI